MYKILAKYELYMMYNSETFESSPTKTGRNTSVKFIQCRYSYLNMYKQLDAVVVTIARNTGITYSLL